MDIMIIPFSALETSSFKGLLLQASIALKDRNDSAENSEFLRQIISGEDLLKEEADKETCQQSNMLWSGILNLFSIYDNRVSAGSLKPLMIQDWTESITNPADSVSERYSFSSQERVCKNPAVPDLPLSRFSLKESETELSINKVTDRIPEGFHTEPDIKISEGQLNAKINLLFNKNQSHDFLKHILSPVNSIKSSLNYHGHNLIKDDSVVNSFRSGSYPGDIESDSMAGFLSPAFIEHASGQPNREIIRLGQDLNLRIKKIEKISSNLEGYIHHIKVSLEPEGLGRLEISLNTEKGLIKGYIHAFDLHSKEVIERNLLNIISMLEREGINIGSLTVGLEKDGRYGDEEKERLFHSKNKTQERAELPLNSRCERQEPLIEGLSIFV